MAVFYLRDKKRCTTDSAVGEGGIGTCHLTDGGFTRSKAEYGACVLVYVRIVQPEVMQNIDKL